jgi:hypothetical protein
MATMLPNALQAGHQLVLALGRALAGQSAQHISGKKPESTPRTSRHRAGQRAGFDRDGYPIIRGALTPDEIAARGRRSVGQAGPPRSTATSGSGVTGKYRGTM